MSSAVKGLGDRVCVLDRRPAKVKLDEAETRRAGDEVDDLHATPVGRVVVAWEAEGMPSVCSKRKWGWTERVKFFGRCDSGKVKVARVFC